MPTPKKKSESDSPLQVRRSTVHGHGVFTVRKVAAGDRLGVYEGRRYPAGVEVTLAGDGACTYLFGLSDGTTIDGSQDGNETRFFNHSCEPNCEAVEEWDEDDHIVLTIVATRPLRRGEEVFIDYSLTIEPGDEALYACRCGAASCRGSMAGPIEAVQIESR